jgi:sulfate permease, SulP family
MGRTQFDLSRLKSKGFGDCVGAFADSAVLFPIIAVLSQRPGFSGGMLLGTTGVVYIVAGLLFRVPMSVQPLKSIAVAAIAVGASFAEVRASGALVGSFCLFLCLFNVDRAASRVPRALVQGLQAGLGVILILQAVKLSGVHPIVALAMAGGIVVLHSITDLPFMGLLATGGMFFGVYKMFMDVAPAQPLAEMTHPTSLRLGLVVALAMPQLVLTAANSVVATRDVARRYFNDRAERVTARRLLSSIGLGNIMIGLIGGLPFCHGSGGVTAHVNGGAKTWKANFVIGMALVVLGAFVSVRAGTTLWYSEPLLAALLAATGVFHMQLAKQTWKTSGERLRLVAMVATAFMTQNMLWILCVGVVLGFLREFLCVLRRICAIPIVDKRP